MKKSLIVASLIAGLSFNAFAQESVVYQGKSGLVVGVENQHNTDGFSKDFNLLNLGYKYYLTNNISVTGVIGYHQNLTKERVELSYDIPLGDSQFVLAPYGALGFYQAHEDENKEDGRFYGYGLELTHSKVPVFVKVGQERLTANNGDGSLTANIAQIGYKWSF